MSDYLFNILLNHSIVAAAVAGAVRAKFILRSFLPFLFFVWLGLLNETISLLLIENGKPNAVNSNLYVLCEYLILLYQFYQWKGCPAKRFVLFAAAGTAIWTADNLVLHSPADNNSLFRCSYSLILLFFSIEQMNRLTVYNSRNLLRQPVFLICSQFLLYYGCKLFVEIFHLYHVPYSPVFYQYLWLTLSVVNCIANIIYAIAILCIPTKQELMLLY